MCSSDIGAPFRGKPMDRAVRFAPVSPFTRAHLEKKTPAAKKAASNAKVLAAVKRQPFGGYVSAYDQKTALGG
jgi:hypothetical protein